MQSPRSAELSQTTHREGGAAPPRGSRARAHDPYHLRDLRRRGAVSVSCRWRVTRASQPTRRPFETASGASSGYQGERPLRAGPRVKLRATPRRHLASSAPLTDKGWSLHVQRDLQNARSRSAARGDHPRNSALPEGCARWPNKSAAREEARGAERPPATRRVTRSHRRARLESESLVERIGGDESAGLSRPPSEREHLASAAGGRRQCSNCASCKTSHAGNGERSVKPDAAHGYARALTRMNGRDSGVTRR